MGHSLLLKDFINEKGFLYKRLDDRYKDAFKYLVERLLDEILHFMPMFIRYYTDHGAYHSKEVVRRMDELTERIKPGINATEAFILLSSAWLHDIGLLNNTDPLTGVYLDDKSIRDRHGELSEVVIEKYRERLFRSNLPKFRRTIECIKLLCKSHTVDKQEVFNGIDDIDGEDIDQDNLLRRKLLISILRLSDLLDLRPNRAPTFSSEIFSMPSESALHWKIYQVIDSCEIIYKQGVSIPSLYIKIMGQIEKTANSSFEENLYYYKAREIEEESQNVKDYFQKSRVSIQDKVNILLSVGDSTKKSLPGLKSSKDFFDESKILFAESEFKILEERTHENPFMLFDYCVNTAETCANKEIQEKWRETAQTYAGRIRDEFPPTSYFLTRIKYNELYLEKLKIGKDGFNYIADIENRVSERQSLREIDLEKKFLYGMIPNRLKTVADCQEEKINILKSLNYLKGIINTVYSDLFTFKLTLFQYGFTTINEEIVRSVVEIVKHRVTPIEKQTDSMQELQFKSLHNECCLCTGQALSILSYFMGMGMNEILPEKFITRAGILDDIKKIFKWIEIQQENGFSKLNGKSRVKSLAATCAVMQGLLDLYFFNSRKKILQGIDNTEIKVLIEQLKSELLKAFEYQQIKKIEKDKFYPITSDFYEYLSAAQYYSQIFADSSFFHRIELGDWVDEIFSIQDRCFLDRIYGCVHPFLLEKCAPGDEKKKITEIAGNYIDEIIRKNYEWRSNGSLNSDPKLTNRALKVWFKYWEHYWRLKEKETGKKQEGHCE